MKKITSAIFGTAVYFASVLPTLAVTGGNNGGEVLGENTTNGGAVLGATGQNILFVAVPLVVIALVAVVMFVKSNRAYKA